MGADLLLATCQAPKIVAGDDVAPEARVDAAKAVIRQRIEAMSDEAVILAAENAGYGYTYEECEDEASMARAIRADLVDDEHGLPVRRDQRRW